MVEKTHRAIRSFVLRKGRMTVAQQRALENLWPDYGIKPADSILDFKQLFDRGGEVIIEIGFGNGESTWQMAQQEADKNFLAIEVHKPGVGHLLLALEDHALNNVRIACADAVPFLQHRIAPGSVNGIRIFFPDPWPKKRHHKRRIIQAKFVDALAQCLAHGGILHLATDWQPYAEYMLEVMQASPDFSNLSTSGDYCERPAWRAHTKYERRGERLGHQVYDLLFERRLT